MSKNKQKNVSEIHLGNETYHRGFNDGLMGRPKSIKKTHRHQHRYHIGYKAGSTEREETARSAADMDATAHLMASERNAERLRQSIAQHKAGNAHVHELVLNLGKPKGFWSRFVAWLRG